MHAKKLLLIALTPLTFGCGAPWIKSWHSLRTVNEVSVHEAKPIGPSYGSGGIANANGGIDPTDTYGSKAPFRGEAR